MATAARFGGADNELATTAAVWALLRASPRKGRDAVERTTTRTTIIIVASPFRRVVVCVAKIAYEITICAQK